MEDCVNTIEVLFPNFDSVFLFNQSFGHTELREDVLNINKMNVTYGGAMKKMHDTIINEIGPYNLLLSIGSVQKMKFQDDDAFERFFSLNPDIRTIY